MFGETKKGFAFQRLKEMLYSAPILSLTEGTPLQKALVILSYIATLRIKDWDVY